MSKTWTWSDHCERLHCLLFTPPDQSRPAGCGDWGPLDSSVVTRPAGGPDVTRCSLSSPNLGLLSPARWSSALLAGEMWGAVWVSPTARSTRGNGKSPAAEISVACSALTVRMRLRALSRIILNYTTATGPAAWWVVPVTPWVTLGQSDTGFISRARLEHQQPRARRIYLCPERPLMQ